MVDVQKISSWFFLVIVSFIIVAELKMLKKAAPVPKVAPPKADDVYQSLAPLS